MLKDCTICYTRKARITTVCGHVFCNTCIHKWLRRSNTCPICRTKLINEEEKEYQTNILMGVSFCLPVSKKVLGDIIEHWPE